MDKYDGQGNPPAGWVKTTYPSIIQKIGRKLDRSKPQCFACQLRFDDWRRGLERAHIVAASSGGDDTASNYVLLCSDCHLDAPMTNHVDWMLEWVDRGPAAQGWRERDAIDAATDAEALAALNYLEYRQYTSVDDWMKYTVKGADISRENFKRTYREVVAEFDPGFHFGQSSFSPATRAYLAMETFGRVALGNRERKGAETLAIG
jgi:hypothetical protein